MSASLNSYLGDITVIEQAVTVEAAAYATGELVGGKLTLTVPELVAPKFNRGGLVQSVVITDLAKQSVNKDVVFFDVDPSATTFTENAALDINDADLLNIIGVAQVLTWADFSDNSVGQALNLAIPFIIGASGTALFAAIVERGAPTYAGTSDLSIRVGILPA